MRLDDGSYGAVYDSIVRLRSRSAYDMIYSLGITRTYLTNETEGRDLRQQISRISPHARMGMSPDQRQIRLRVDSRIQLAQFGEDTFPDGSIP